MLVLPVLDVQQGVSVHGRAGQRSKYRPVKSLLASDSEPLGLAKAFRERLSLSDLYLADLDAICFQRPNLALYDQLQSAGFGVWLDAGICDLATALSLQHLWGSRGWHPIVALETLASEGELRELLAWFTPPGMVLSLDLENGRPRTRIAAWHDLTAIDLALQLVALGVQRLILLDLTRVGTGQGTGTQELIRMLREQHGSLQLIGGGGVASFRDALELAQTGCDGILLASTLHDGRIGPAETRQLLSL
jgi:phosphoribosylformimino-5-aminoimidazole carboxamide ribotide isomerase